jgi:hypothetical protein
MQLPEILERRIESDGGTQPTVGPAENTRGETRVCIMGPWRFSARGDHICSLSWVRHIRARRRMERT